MFTNKQRFNGVRIRKKKKKKYFYDSQSKKDGPLRQPIACYEIAKRTYNFVTTYVGNRTINMTLVMPFLVGNKPGYLGLVGIMLKVSCMASALFSLVAVLYHTLIFCLYTYISSV